MPKYKEIFVNLKLSQEAVLGEVIKNAVGVKADQTIKEDTTKSEQKR